MIDDLAEAMICKGLDEIGTKLLTCVAALSEEPTVQGRDGHDYVM